MKQEEHEKCWPETGVFSEGQWAKMSERKSALLISQISACVFLATRVAGRQKTSFLLFCLSVFKTKSQCEQEMCNCPTVTHGMCGIWHRFLRSAVSVLSDCTDIEMCLGRTAWPGVSDMTGLISCWAVGMVMLLGREEQQRATDSPFAKSKKWMCLDQLPCSWEKGIAPKQWEASHVNSTNNRNKW